MPPYAALLPPTCYLAVSQCSVSGFSWCRNYLNGQFLFWSIAYLGENYKGLQKYNRNKPVNALQHHGEARDG